MDIEERTFKVRVKNIMGIRVIVAGASGKMGQEVVKLVQETEQFHLVCGVSRTYQNQDVGEAIGIGTIGIPMVASVKEALKVQQADVLIDFTTPEVVKEHAKLALEAGVRPVIGTSGLSEESIQDIAKLAKEKRVGAIIAPNFAIGAVLMMVFAAKAARYLPHVEIIESHHDQKLDAPSGTAIKTAEGIQKERAEIKQGHPNEEELIEGARGAYYHGFRVHSVRLPGLVAHQEVLFGGSGQLLTIRHDSFHRQSFMPGVKIAVEKVMKLQSLVYGLEHVIDI